MIFVKMVLPLLGFCRTERRSPLKEDGRLKATLFYSRELRSARFRERESPFRIFFISTGMTSFVMTSQ